MIRKLIYWGQNLLALAASLFLVFGICYVVYDSINKKPPGCPDGLVWHEGLVLNGCVGKDF